MNIEEKLKSKLVETLELSMNWNDLDNNLDLLVHFNIDSVTVLEFLVGIEEDFGIEIKDEELSIELLRSINQLSNFIKSKLDTLSSEKAK